MAAVDYYNRQPFIITGGLLFHCVTRDKAVFILLKETNVSLDRSAHNVKKRRALLWYQESVSLRMSLIVHRPHKEKNLMAVNYILSSHYDRTLGTDQENLWASLKALELRFSSSARSLVLTVQPSVGTCHYGRASSSWCHGQGSFSFSFQWAVMDIKIIKEALLTGRYDTPASSFLFF